MIIEDVFIGVASRFAGTAGITGCSGSSPPPSPGFSGFGFSGSSPPPSPGFSGSGFNVLAQAGSDFSDSVSFLTAVTI